VITKPVFKCILNATNVLFRLKASNKQGHSQNVFLLNKNQPRKLPHFISARKTHRSTHLRIRRHYSGRQLPRNLDTTVHRLRSLQSS